MLIVLIKSLFEKTMYQYVIFTPYLIDIQYISGCHFAFIKE